MYLLSTMTLLTQFCKSHAKGLEAELAPPHAQSAWGSRGERIRAAGLVTCCNYFSKKKKRSSRIRKEKKSLGILG